MKRILTVFVSLVMLFAWMLPASAATLVSISILSPDTVYNGAARTSSKDLYLYGDANTESYVTYTVEIPEDGVYSLNGTYGLQGAVEYTELRFSADGVKIPDTTQLPKTATAWTRQSGVLHAKIPFLAGSRKLTVTLCDRDVKSGVLLFGLYLTRVGDYEPIETDASTPVPEIDIVSPTEISDGEIRSDSVYLYGQNNSLSRVAYPISVEVSGVYRLSASLALSSAEDAQLYVAVDGTKLEKTAVIPPHSTAWTKQNAVLYDRLILPEGEHTICISQAEKKCPPAFVCTHA
ncbi:MAG: hypothetical protein IJ367_02100 [Clostridia bacterium]|nr:hypothetical protein [Clostridia bacterium]